jgi:hypothetical protein
MSARIEIYDDSGNDARRWQLARKLARTVYYLNANSVTQNAFVNGGVWGKRFGNWNSNGLCLVINGKYTVDATPFFFEDRENDQDLRYTSEGILHSICNAGDSNLTNYFSRWTFRQN